VTLVVNTGLDAVSNVDTELSLSVSKSVIDSEVGLEGIDTEVVVLRKVGEVLEGLFAGVGGSLLGADVLIVSTSGLNPSGEGLDVSGETVGRVRLVGDDARSSGGFLLLHVVGGSGGKSGGSSEHSHVHATFGLLLRAEGTHRSGSHGLGLRDHGSNVRGSEHNYFYCIIINILQ